LAVEQTCFLACFIRFIYLARYLISTDDNLDLTNTVIHFLYGMAMFYYTNYIIHLLWVSFL